MPFPQTVPTDRQIALGILGVGAMLLVFWVLFTYLERYAERKEKELEKELEELEESGEVY